MRRYPSGVMTRITGCGIAALALLGSADVRAQTRVQSPRDFLGYEIGEHFTDHASIVRYFDALAAAAPIVRLRRYGDTNENRPLLQVLIARQDYLARLDEILARNRELANPATSEARAREIAATNPAVVYFSYGVHGNESSSSEAALWTAYHLASGDHAVRGVLDSVVVVIDPTVNPDGRDRYVNFYRIARGVKPNPNPEAREHFEPWPGGRTNHYYFDLNRDWAWQTQLETQQRVALYNSWLPQIHVDFHEQGINAPYYFAPAAEPFHEVITPWQRSFQETIGRNHARYFDEQGWLYFTKENFDLLYPAYGDTYPTYTGSIGMTYEQAGGGGGGRSGASVIIATGDTLTLYDRALHHHTTGLSTIEVASQNAPKLVSEFQQFYKGTVQKGAGSYRNYVIKHTPADGQRLNSLLNLMQKNGITVTRGRGTGLR